MLVLAILAGVRILAGSTILPIFTLVDEKEHYDLIVKVARGHWPDAETDHYDFATARQILLYGSPEYWTRRDVLKVQPAKPLWKFEASIREPYVEDTARRMAAMVNYEAHSPPVYYLLAAAWSKLGFAFGLREGFVIYWVRFLNAVLYPLFVVLSYVFIRRFYPEETFLRIGTTILLATFPQDVFFTMNSDVASPLFFLAALFLLLSWSQQDRSAIWLGMAAGFMVAMTFLVKYSNIAIVVVAAIAFVRKLFSAVRKGQMRVRRNELLLATLAAAVPVLCWLGRNAVVLGDGTGSQSKMATLGWTYKPVAEWGDHPLFTTLGLAYFFSELIRNFWIGEIVWQFERIVPAGYDWFFIIGSLLCLPAAAVRWRGQSRSGETGRTPDGWLIVAMAASVAFLMLISLLFDFGDCFYPSREAPYFVSGRLIIGMLGPAIILFVRGLEALLFRWSDSVKLTVVASIGLISLACQFSLFAAVYTSEFNWFHLR